MGVFEERGLGHQFCRAEWNFPGTKRALLQRSLSHVAVSHLWNSLSRSEWHRLPFNEPPNLSFWGGVLARVRLGKGPYRVSCGEPLYQKAVSPPHPFLNIIVCVWLLCPPSPPIKAFSGDILISPDQKNLFDKEQPIVLSSRVNLSAYPMPKT